MNYGSTHEALKPMAEVFLPDPRFEFFGIFPAEGDRRMAQKDIHARLAAIKLSPSIPDDVRRQCETARNLMLYSWFVFEFHTVAEMQALATLEFALRTRMPAQNLPNKSKPDQKQAPETLKPLLRRAYRDGLIVPAELPTWKEALRRRAEHRNLFGDQGSNGRTAEQWFEGVIEALPVIRNNLAHGQPKLHFSGAMFQLTFCLDLINALFPESTSKAPATEP